MCVTDLNIPIESLTGIAIGRYEMQINPSEQVLAGGTRWNERHKEQHHQVAARQVARNLEPDLVGEPLGTRVGYRILLALVLASGSDISL